MISQEQHPFGQSVCSLFIDPTTVPFDRSDATRRQRIVQYQNRKALRLIHVPVSYLESLIRQSSSPLFSSPSSSSSSSSPSSSSISSSSLFSSVPSKPQEQQQLFPSPASYTYTSHNEPWRVALPHAFVSDLTTQCIFHNFDGWMILRPPNQSQNQISSSFHRAIPSYLFDMVWLLKPVPLLKLMDDDKQPGMSQRKLTDMFSVMSIKRSTKPKKESPTYDPELTIQEKETKDAVIKSLPKSKKTKTRSTGASVSGKPSTNVDGEGAFRTLMVYAEGSETQKLDREFFQRQDMDGDFALYPSRLTSRINVAEERAYGT